VKGAAATDIGTGGANSSVANIVADSTNQGTESQAGYTTFYFTGSGYASNGSSSSRIAVSVNLSGVTDANSLATAINAGIQTAANGSTQQATAFKNAGVQASIYTDATTGKSSLQFTSSTSAFQVEAGDKTSNALLGNIASGSTGQSVAATTTATAYAVTAPAADETIKLGVTVGGSTTAVTVSLVAATDTTPTLVLGKVNAALTAANAGVTASLDGSNHLLFTATNANQSKSVEVSASGDAGNALGLGTYAASSGSPNAITGAAGAAGTAGQHVQIAIGGQVADLALVSTGTEGTDIAALNAALQGNALTRAAGIIAQDNGGNIQLVSNNSTAFRVNEYGAASAGFGFETATSVNSSAVASLKATAQTGTGAPSLDANGTSTSGFLNFQGITIAGNSQTVSLTAPDSAGANHSISFSLSSVDAANIDAALATINNQLLTSNDATLQTIVAVKDQAPGANGADGIRFVSTLANFSVSLGTTATGTASAGVIQGISDGTGTTSQGGASVASTQLGIGSTSDISTEANAQNAVTAISNAVTSLGRAQAAVGKGENLFNFASNLAQSQVTNDAAAESGIRDADLAAEAANLSKAQILVQAGTAALAQANSAPQAILALLRG
jgi:flagellin